MIKRLYNKYETYILYIVFGILTTAINFACFFILRKLNVNLYLSNTIAWIVAVLFAFFSNKKYVFNNKSHSFIEFIKTLLLFFSARLASLIIFDIFFMYIMVDVLHMNEMVAKIIDNIGVIIFNFIASKFIFKNKDAA